MTADAPHSREAAAKSEAHEALVDLLTAYVDQAYVTAGQPGALAAVRDLFRRMDEAALTTLAYQLDLAAEPAADEESEGRG
jgi:hypothetical protein